jgi:DNA-binding response OmpR family regulator
MAVEPSCPALVIHDDDVFRKALIAKLDENNFTVTFATDDDSVTSLLDDRVEQFHVILVGIDVQKRPDAKSIEFLRENRERVRCGIILLGEPDPALRTFAPWADETLMKPVDPAYIVKRARTYCSC